MNLNQKKSKNALCSLRCVWHEGEGNGQVEFQLQNNTGSILENFFLCYTSQLYPLECENAISNGSMARLDGSFNQITPPPGLVLTPGDTWTFDLKNLFFAPRNETDGPLSAYVLLASGQIIPVEITALERHATTKIDNPNAKTIAPYEGIKLALTPWPNGVNVTNWQNAPTHFLTNESLAQCVLDILFPDEAPAFCELPGGLPLKFALNGAMGDEDYKLCFNEKCIDISHGVHGQFYALITLAQILRGTRNNPKHYLFPGDGSTIEDAPRYTWRGAHLDVARQFFSKSEIKHFLTEMAWVKLNKFHWHLSDDEAWRVEIKALPQLTQIGATRGHRKKIPPQLGDSAEGQTGFYTQDDIREIVAFAKNIKIEIMPEIDMPGHASAILRSVPDLTDPDEKAQSYRSVQSFYNNSLNPALPQTEQFIDSIFEELIPLFPFKIFHIGGDEVPENAWMQSPIAVAKMTELNYSPVQMQGQFTRDLQNKLAHCGKQTGGWDEIGAFQNISTQNTSIFLWRDAKAAVNLAEKDFDIIMSPATHYYLDIRASKTWNAPGASWAGTSSLKHTYDYTPPDLKNISGVQCGIWTEKMQNRRVFDQLVFPRFHAIAETAWTNTKNKNWPRFSFISGLFRN